MCFDVERNKAGMSGEKPYLVSDFEGKKGELWKGGFRS